MSHGACRPGALSHFRVALAGALLVAHAGAAAAQAQRSSSALSFILQAGRPELVLFLEVRTSKALAGYDGWRSTAQSLARDTRVTRYDVATQIITVSDELLRMDEIIRDILEDWEKQPQSPLKYEAIWLVTDPEGGAVARELVVRQPLVAARVRGLAWYYPSGTLRSSNLAVTSSLPESGTQTQLSDPQMGLARYVQRQNQRWLSIAGARDIDVHCASPGPVATSELQPFACRSMSIVLDPSQSGTPGGTANFQLWLQRVTRLPSSTQRAKPPAVFSMRLAAPDPLQVSCGATSYSAPRIVLPESVKGKIVSAHGILEGADKISRGSVTVREFTDREVFVTAELVGLPLPALPTGCPTGTARAVVLVTIVEGAIIK